MVSVLDQVEAFYSLLHQTGSQKTSDMRTDTTSIVSPLTFTELFCK